MIWKINRIECMYQGPSMRTDWLTVWTCNCDCTGKIQTTFFYVSNYIKIHLNRSHSLSFQLTPHSGQFLLMYIFFIFFSLAHLSENGFVIRFAKSVFSIEYCTIKSLFRWRIRRPRDQETEIETSEQYMQMREYETKNNTLGWCMKWKFTHARCHWRQILATTNRNSIALFTHIHIIQISFLLFLSHKSNRCRRCS